MPLFSLMYYCTALNQPPPTNRCAVHKLDSLKRGATDSPEAVSESIKRIKPHVVKKIIDKHDMSQCMIFCRTNFDCDNLETFLNECGGGGGPFRGKKESGPQNAYSCCVLGKGGGIAARI